MIAFDTADEVRGSIVNVCVDVEHWLSANWPKWRVKCGGTAYLDEDDSYKILFLAEGLRNVHGDPTNCSVVVDFEVALALESGYDFSVAIVRDIVEDAILDRIEEGEWVYAPE